jgi:hypothetical protein
MKSLKEVLATADRNKLIEDVVSLIDGEVDSKGGLSGMALKGGYKVVKRLKGGRMIHKAVGFLLDDFTGAVEPLHDEYRQSGATGSFADFLVRNDARATDALLGITDGRIGQAENPVIKKTYKKLRPQATGHVKAALPGLGRLIDGYTAGS